MLLKEKVVAILLGHQCQKIIANLRCRECVGREVGCGDDVLHAEASAVGGRVDVGEAPQLGGLTTIEANMRIMRLKGKFDDVSCK